MSGTLSVVMITKNEADRMRDALESVQWADEIVVVDSGSTDDTVKIAESYGAKVFHQDWLGFGPQRQVAQSKATKDWIFTLDADEKVTPTLQRSIQTAVQKNDQTKAYGMRRMTVMLGPAFKSVRYPDFSLRLFPKKSGHYSDHLIHEALYLDKNITVEKLDGDLDHFTCRSLQEYLHKTVTYAQKSTEQLIRRKKKVNWLTMITHSIAAFFRVLFQNRHYLEGEAGFISAALAAYSTFIKYALLWDHYHTVSPTPTDDKKK